MAKSTTSYSCSACGNVTTKWSGRCEACGEWNTIVEDGGLSVGPKKGSIGGMKGNAIKITDLASQEAPCPAHILGLMSWTVFWAVVWCQPLRFCGWRPGDWEINPSLQAAARFSEAGLKVLYISGEEASAQVRMRAQRLGLGSANVQLGAATNLRNILTTMDTEKPDLVIIDSIQTMWADTVESAPGSVSQVRSAAHELTTFAKRKGASVILVGHVTKEGQIAGPRVVEHMVDTVLYFEGERGHQFRILRAVKNRFGASDEIGVFEMSGRGLEEVKNPLPYS